MRGYWGFASSPYLTADEAARPWDKRRPAKPRSMLRLGAPRLAELGTIPIVRTGQWVMPGIAPFTGPVEEKLDWLQGLLEVATQSSRFIDKAFVVGGAPREPPESHSTCWRESRVFASSEGASYTQTRYRCMPTTNDPFLMLEVASASMEDLPWGRRMGQLPDRHLESESVVCTRVGVVT